LVEKVCARCEKAKPSYMIAYVRIANEVAELAAVDKAA
jgi:hypothetical protein